jgi:membrane associated rhomboid family serine protease
MRPRTSLASRLTPGVGWILGLYVAAFLLYLFSGKPGEQFFRDWLVLTPGSLLRGHVWKLATGPLVALQGISFFFDCFMLWMFVPTLERFWGMRRFLGFAVGASIAGGLVGALVGLALGQPDVAIGGLAPFIYGSIAAFGIVYGKQQVNFFGVLPLKANVLALGIAAILALSTILGGTWVTGAASFAGMGYAWIATRGFTPSVFWLRLRRWWLRRKLGVIDGGRGSKNDQTRWMN